MTSSLNRLVLMGTVVAIDNLSTSGPSKLLLVRIRTQRGARRGGVHTNETTVAVWNGLAERALRVLRIGEGVAIEGHLSSRRRVDADTGDVRFTNDVICDRFVPVCIEDESEDLDEEPNPMPSSIDANLKDL